MSAVRPRRETVKKPAAWDRCAAGSLGDAPSIASGSRQSPCQLTISFGGKPPWPECRHAAPEARGWHLGKAAEALWAWAGAAATFRARATPGRSLGENGFCETRVLAARSASRSV